MVVVFFVFPDRLLELLLKCCVVPYFDVVKSLFMFGLTFSVNLLTFVCGYCCHLLM